MSKLRNKEIKRESKVMRRYLLINKIKKEIKRELRLIWKYRLMSEKKKEIKENNKK